MNNHEHRWFQHGNNSTDQFTCLAPPSLLVWMDWSVLDRLNILDLMFIWVTIQKPCDFYTLFSFSGNPCKFQPPKTEDVRMPQVFKGGFESDSALQIIYPTSCRSHQWQNAISWLAEASQLPPAENDACPPALLRRQAAGGLKIHILISKYFGKIGSNPNSAQAENRWVQGCACITQG